MGGPRKTSTKMTAPRRGGNSSRGASSRGGRGGRGGSHNKPTGKGGFAERSKGAPKGDEDENTYDVFEAEDHEDFGKRRRRNVERVDVRDYEIENIDSEDDEEIDSDDAFNESDEERFASYKRLPGTSSRKDAESEEESEEEEEEEDDEEDLVDLSEMLDASASEDEAEGLSKAAAPPLLSPSALGFDDLAVDGAEDEDSDDQAFAGMDSDSDASVASDDNDEDEDEAAERLSKLDGFVTSISARAPRRRFVVETGGGYAEDENAIGSGLGTKGVSLGINDLLGSLGGHVDEAEGGEHQGLRQIRDLKNQVTKLDKAAKKAGAGVVAAPLAKRLQDQMDRK
ncbi:hypothetical protein GGI24_003679, partial [Coemansia furcata]